MPDSADPLSARDAATAADPLSARDASTAADLRERFAFLPEIVADMQSLTRERSPALHFGASPG